MKGNTINMQKIKSSWGGVLNSRNPKGLATHLLVATFCSALGISFISSSLLGLGIDNTYADTSSTINITFTNPNPTIDLNVTSAAGSFAKSSDMGISVSSDNFSGFTLTIKGDDAQGRLKGKNVENNYLPTISSNITEATYGDEANTTYNSTWGFKPSKYNSIDNTGSNSYFYPGPTTTATTIDNITNNNNIAAATTSNYTISIGARANMETIKDSYQGTFTITATPNAPAYTINYGSTTGSPTNMPTTTTGYINQTTRQITITDTIPTRTDGYEFQGWCTVETSNDTCSGDTIPADGTYTFTNINYTTMNNLTLYAIWEQPLPYMQDIDDWRDDLTVNEQIQVKDKRDNKVYWVALLADGNIWMTQNLDFDIPTTPLSSTTTDLTSFDVGGYTAANGYSKDATTGEITWTPVRSTINASSMTITDTSYSFSGWTNDYYTPYSVDVGERYVDGDAWYSYTDDCKTAGGSNATTGHNCENHFKETPYTTNGTHGALGNYYNWSAAIAANNSSSWSSNTLSNIANNPQNSICPAGWRLPTASNASNTLAGSTNEFARLNYLYNTNKTNTDEGLFGGPLFLARAGYVYGGNIRYVGYDSNYRSSSVYSADRAYYLYFDSSYVDPAYHTSHGCGISVRCIAREPVRYMQDVDKWRDSLTTNEQVEAVDKRDGKKYWVALLEDGNIWMTQNLDFDIPTTPLSSTTTDLTSYNVGGYTTANGYAKNETTGEITWTPIRGTIPSTALTNEAVTNSRDWVNDNYAPYSVDVGDWYYDGDDTSDTCVYLASNANCIHFATTPFESTGTHGHVGNYYNWSAAVAANNTNITPWTSATYNNIDNSPKNSICPAGWRLAHASSESETVPGSTAEFSRLNYLYNGTPDASVKDKNLLKAPLYLARAGYFDSGKLTNSGLYGRLWSSTVYSSAYARYWYFRASAVNPASSYDRNNGYSLRCVAR